MEFLPHNSDHVCYVRCSLCNIVLAVGIPSKRASETVTVKCGRCGNLSFFSTRFSAHYQPPDNFQMSCQGFCPELKINQPLPTDTLSANSAHKTPFVVKPPEKKHRLPSAYNRFMKEEIQRIKAAKPEIHHREAFSMAAKNVKNGLGSIQTHPARRSILGKTINPGEAAAAGVMKTSADVVDCSI